MCDSLRQPQVANDKSLPQRGAGDTGHKCQLFPSFYRLKAFNVIVKQVADGD